MIEMGRLPLLLIVTSLALGTVSSGVGILKLMTIHALGADTLVTFANMACGTGDRAVRALEWKPGRTVIERLDPAPSGFAVAIVAFFAEAPFVGVFRLMAVEAASRRIAEFCCRCVAAGARHRLVGVAKPKIRLSMIEGLAIQLDDVGVAPLMIGMTMAAFGLCGIRMAPMESLAGRSIRCGFLVARKAEPGLRFSREGLMAVAALFLELCMAVNKRPGHDKLLE
jgi:hypothetical protein